jgi:hypothetical protein
MELPRLSQVTQSRLEPDIDMDLAYGDIPPPLPAKNYDDSELREKASTLTRILEEANCLQYSVTTIIDDLQKNPDTLAAVALILAEISTMAGKMGPGVLTVLKGSFPAVAGLLISPQFMIAAGVGIGVTIVALGGFKIIKKIQAQREGEAFQAQPMRAPAPEEPLQLDELESQELGRIEVWRRGIADVEAVSNGSTVDGEFVTPGATRHLVAAGLLDEDDLRSRRSTRTKDDKEHRSKSHKAKSVKSTKSSSTSRSKTPKESSSKSTKEKEKEKEKVKVKKPSGLRKVLASALS